MNGLNVDFVLAPTAYHSNYLTTKAKNWDMSFQLVTKEQLIRDLIFSVDIPKVLPGVITELKLTLDYALSLLNMLTFIPDATVLQDSLGRDLCRVYDYLAEQQLLVINPLASYKYASKAILVDGYDPKDPQLMGFFNQTKMKVAYVPILTPPQSITIQRFETIEDEVSWFFNQVGLRLSEGRNLNDMYLIDPGPNYHHELNRQARYFGIPIQLPREDNILSLPISQWVLKQLRIGRTLDDIWGMDHPFTLTDFQLVKSILKPNVFNQMNHHEIETYVHFQFKNTSLKSPRFHEAIQVVRDTYPLDHHDVFMLGFAQGRYPVSNRQAGGLPDSTKATLGLMTTAKENELKRSRLQQLLARSQHLHLSYANIEQGVSMLPSPLIQSLKMVLVQGSYNPNQVDFSGRLGFIRREQYRYTEKRFHYRHPNLTSYETHFPEPTAKYQYYFKAISNNLSNKDMKLSYSAIKDFYQCGFKYYVGRILKVTPMNQDLFFMHLGTFAHEVFEMVGDKLNDFNDIFDGILKKQKDLTEREKVLFHHLKDQLLQVCTFNVMHQRAMQNPEIISEAEMNLKLDHQTSLIGFIDKIVVVKDVTNQAYLAVVDYKSGQETFDEQLLPYGWSLQLPIYAWMLAHHPSYQDKPILGVFIQHILHTSFAKKPLIIHDKEFSKTYQLDGIALADHKQLSYLDATFSQGKSLFIEGVGLKKGGDFRVSKTLKTPQDFMRYLTVAEVKMNEANQGIRSGNFVINPKKIKQKSSCDHCSFLDVCFRQASDVTQIDLHEVETEDTDDDSN